MSSPAPPKWEWDEAKQLWYYFHPIENCYVYESGLRLSPDVTVLNQPKPGPVSLNAQNQHLQSYSSPSRNDAPTNSHPLSQPKIIMGTRGREESLYTDFVVTEPGHFFFQVGVVFKLLWSEPAGSYIPMTSNFATGNISTDNRYVEGRFGQSVFTEFRWFVVIRDGVHSCTCLRIQKFNGQGVTSNKIKRDHAIIYTGSTPPKPLPEEISRPEEEPMGTPIRVIPNRPGDKMHPLSRLNFSKVYTVKHNVKVYDFGRIDMRDEYEFISQWKRTWGITEPKKSRAQSPSSSTSRSSLSPKVEHKSFKKVPPPQGISKAQSPSTRASNHLLAESSQTGLSNEGSTNYGLCPPRSLQNLEKFSRPLSEVGSTVTFPEHESAYPGTYVSGRDRSYPQSTPGIVDPQSTLQNGGQQPSSHYMPYPVKTTGLERGSPEASGFKIPVEASIIGVSDSGYASLPQQTAKQRSQFRQVDETQETSTSHRGAPEKIINSETEKKELEEIVDNESIYSIAPDTITPGRDTYISELVEDVWQNIPTTTGFINEAAIERFFSILPRLLKSFARKIGYSGQCGEARDVMVFIHKERRTIVAALLKEHMHSRPTEQDSMWREKVLKWLNSMHEKNDERPDDNCDRGSEAEDVEIEETSVPKDLAGYRALTVRNPGYAWFLARLESSFLLVPAEPNHMQAISDTILNGLSHREFRRLSRKKAPHLCDMTFTVDWDPIVFLQEQEYDGRPEQALERAVTLTGTERNAEALTTAQYLRQTWPLVGEEVLRVVKRVVQCGGSAVQTGRMSDHTNLSAYLIDNRFHLQVIGILDSVAEIGEVVAWLGAALRSSTVEHGVAYCYPIIDNLSTGVQEADKTIVTSNIRFRITTDQEDEPSKRMNGSCWHDIFRNPVLVQGYPIPIKPQKNMGIEMPIEIMAGLVGSNRISTFAKNLFIKRYSAMLVLTKRIGNILVWHFLFNKTGDHISYADSRVCASETQDYMSVLTEEHTRHVLGWCSQVQNLAGDPTANYRIKWSKLSISPPRNTIEKLSITVGKTITAGVSIALGKKDKPVHLEPRDDYIRQLRWISKRFVVLYDVEDRRAWLVDGVSALLHLVRTSLETDLSDDFAAQSCFKLEHLEEADRTSSAKAAAIAVLTSVANQELKLYHKSVKKTKKSYYYFKDRVQQVNHLLELIFTYQSEIDSDSGIDIGAKYVTRNHLEGFDFRDVATDDDPIWRRTASLKSRGRGWVDFTRAIHAPTLFGRGFGEIFKPSTGRSCPSWTVMPKGCDYLTVCCSDLDIMLDKHGDTLTRQWKITDNIYWHCPDKAFEEDCRCIKGSKSSCDRVQVLFPKGFRTLWTSGYQSPCGLPHSGAVLFGHSRKFPLRWPAQGNPEQGEPEPEDTDDESSAPFQDSGIGSSVGPNSTLQTARSSDTPSNSASPAGVISSSSSSSLDPRATSSSQIASSIESASLAKNAPITTPISRPPASNTEPPTRTPQANSPALEPGMSSNFQALFSLLRPKKKILGILDRLWKRP